MHHDLTLQLHHIVERAKKLGIPQTRLSRVAGYNDRHVSGMLHGRTITVESLRRIGEAMDRIEAGEIQARTRARRLTPEQITMAVREREDGARIVDLARKYGTSERTIHYHVRERKESRTLPDETVREMLRLRGAGLSIQQISDKIDVAYSTVWRHIGAAVDLKQAEAEDWLQIHLAADKLRDRRESPAVHRRALAVLARHGIRTVDDAMRAGLSPAIERSGASSLVG